MTREEAIKHGQEQLEVFGGEHRKFIELSIKALEFAQWVANEIFDEDWEFNKDSFEEVTCRKLEKLGIVRKTDNSWVLVESSEE